jgi:hypothetical protein
MTGGHAHNTIQKPEVENPKSRYSIQEKVKLVVDIGHCDDGDG